MHLWAIIKEIVGVLPLAVWVRDGHVNENNWFTVLINSIHAKYINPFIQPKSYYPVKYGLYLLVLPVGVRLFPTDVVQIVLLGCFIPLPDAATKYRTSC